MASHRRGVKLRLVAEAGGRCALCGYDRFSGALQFHHVDPETKRFGLAERGLTRSIEVVNAEARKCVLLCANCHAEVEAGFRTLPSGLLAKVSAADNLSRAVPGGAIGSAADC